MIEPENSWLSASGGVELFCSHWRADLPRATVVLTHGWGDHQGRYAELIEYLWSHDYSVLAHDLRGHGKSRGQRGYARDFATLVEDIELVIKQVATSQARQAPILLYGQSMGGLLTLCWMDSYRQLVDSRNIRGVVLTSPLLEIRMNVPVWKRLAGKTLGKLFPRMTLKAGIDLAHLSRESGYANKIASDPLRQGRISAGVFFGMIEAMKKLSKISQPWPCPMLLMHGSEDRITSHQASQAFAQRFPDTIEYLELPGMYHELHAEIERGLVFKTIGGWLDSQIAGAK